MILNSSRGISFLISSYSRLASPCDQTCCFSAPILRGLCSDFNPSNGTYAADELKRPGFNDLVVNDLLDSYAIVIVDLSFLVVRDRVHLSCKLMLQAK